MKRPLFCLLVLLAAACSSSEDGGGGPQTGGSDGGAGSAKGGSSGTGGSAGATGGNKTGGSSNTGGSATDSGADVKDTGIVDGDSGNARWVATWGAANQETEAWNLPQGADGGAFSLAGMTIRQFVHVGSGGNQVRLKLSNDFGDSPMVLDAVHVAASKPGDAGLPNGTIDPSTDTAVKFSGTASVTIPAGQHVTSDAFTYNLVALSDLAITIHVSQISATKVTGHPGSRTTSYIQQGDAVAAATLTTISSPVHWYIIEGLDVAADADTSAVVVLGDSIADGRGSTNDTNNRWPNVFATRLRANAATAKVSMINMSIGGNAVFNGGIGPSAKTRFQHDVLDQAGVKWVIVAEGVNDIGNVSTANAVTADAGASEAGASEAGTSEAGTDAGRLDASVEGGTEASTTPSGGVDSNQVAQGLIAAYQDFIAKAHSRNLKVYGVPIPPIGQTTYYNTDAGINNILAEREFARVTVNNWIKATGHFDAVMDLPAVITDTSAIPPAMLPAYWNNDGDRLHPNAAGHQKMGEACELSLFTQ